MSSNSHRRNVGSTVAVSVVATALCAWTAMPARAALIDIEIAPPAPRVEVVPPARVGFEWAPGYWNYVGRQHVWVAGHWEKARPGHHWVAARWVQHDGGHYRFEAGHWD
jgi:hypothetical protein